MEERMFGNTGEKFTILSFGAQRVVDDHGCSEKEAIEMILFGSKHNTVYSFLKKQKVGL